MIQRTDFAQPWLTAGGDRIRGNQLTGDTASILSLDEEAMPSRRAIMVMDWHLRRATLVGNPAPIVADMHHRLSHPRPGDLVIECTTGNFAAQQQRGDWYRAIGILLLQRIEWASTDQEWQAELDADNALSPDDRGNDEITYVQYGPAPADVCRWGNCAFSMIPFDNLGPLS